MREDILVEIRKLISSHDNRQLLQNLTDILTSSTLHNFLKLSNGYERFSRFIESELNEVSSEECCPTSEKSSTENGVPKMQLDDLLGCIKSKFLDRVCILQSLTSLEAITNGSSRFHVLKIRFDQQHLLEKIVTEPPIIFEDYVLLPVDHSLQLVIGMNVPQKNRFIIRTGPRGCLARFCYPGLNLKHVTIDFDARVPPVCLNSASSQHIILLPPLAEIHSEMKGELDSRLVVVITGKYSTMIESV
jgi:hypothetical protein